MHVIRPNGNGRVRWNRIMNIEHGLIPTAIGDASRNVIRQNFESYSQTPNVYLLVRFITVIPSSVPVRHQHLEKGERKLL